MESLMIILGLIAIILLIILIIAVRKSNKISYSPPNIVDLNLEEVNKYNIIILHSKYQIDTNVVINRDIIERDLIEDLVKLLLRDNYIHIYEVPQSGALDVMRKYEAKLTIAVKKK